jgi:outer membrane protein TolC
MAPRPRARDASADVFAVVLHARTADVAANDFNRPVRRAARAGARVEYDHGIVGCLQLLDAEKALFANEIAEVQTRSKRYVSTVLLIKALGGGWTPEDAQRELAGEPDAQAR